MNKFVFVLSLVVLASIACRPVKKIQAVINNKDTSSIIKITDPGIDSALVKKEILRKVNSNNIDFNYFSGKIKLDFTDQKNKNTNATVFVRVKKDSVIWVSITGALGIEGYRILLKPDTVLVMDKLEKAISYRSVSFLQEMVKLPLDFYTVQDILVGNPVFFPDNIVSFRNNGSNLLALSVGEYFKHLITIDTTANLVQHSKLDDVDELRNRTCDITLSDYNIQQGRNFSNNREITVTEKAKLYIKLEYKQVTFDEPTQFPFNIPKNYTIK